MKKSIGPEIDFFVFVFLTTFCGKIIFCIWWNRKSTSVSKEIVFYLYSTGLELDIKVFQQFGWWIKYKSFLS